MESETEEAVRGATPELAEQRPELLVNWQEEIENSTVANNRPNSRIKIFRETYKGIPYEIHVLYQKERESMEEFDHGMWATLEQPEGMEKLYEAIGDFLESAGAYIRGDDFCFADTAHSWNEGQNINDRIQEMRTIAHDDIDTLYHYLDYAGRIFEGVRSIMSVLSKGDLNV